MQLVHIPLQRSDRQSAHATFAVMKRTTRSIVGRHINTDHRNDDLLWTGTRRFLGGHGGFLPKKKVPLKHALVVRIDPALWIDVPRDTYRALELCASYMHPTKTALCVSANKENIGGGDKARPKRALGL